MSDNQTDALAKLAEIPPVGSEERERWLMPVRPPGLGQRCEGYFILSENDVLTLMSEARKQGQRDILGEPSGTGSREPSPSVSASGFDPSRGFAEIKAKQATLGMGLVDITIIHHEGKAGVLFSPRAEHVEFGAGGVIQAGEYWPTANDIVLWVDGEGPGVAISYLSQLPLASCDGSAEGGETGTGSTEGNSAVGLQAETHETTPSMFIEGYLNDLCLAGKHPAQDPKFSLDNPSLPPPLPPVRVRRRTPVP